MIWSMNKDVIPINGSKRAGAVRTPIMPGGLFAMDRAWFFEIGDDIGYDPEILYYGVSKYNKKGRGGEVFQ